MTADTYPETWTEYTGRENEGNGIYYYRARYYSPVLGRFISQDPIGIEGGINQYVYVSDNPTNAVDPLGLAELSKPKPQNTGPGLAGRQCPCFNPNFLQTWEIYGLSFYSQYWNKTVGIGGGLSGGAGFVMGVSGGASGQLVVSPNGNAGLEYTWGCNTIGCAPYPVGPTQGAGILGGLQVSMSNARQPQDLAGGSVDVAAGGGAGAGGA